MKTLNLLIFLLGSSLIFGQEPIRYDYYNSNIKKSKGLMRVSKNGEPLTGIVYGKYNNGQLEFEESYVNGKKEGDHNYYNKKGQLIESSNYYDDLFYYGMRYKYLNDKDYSEVYYKEIVRDYEFDTISGMPITDKKGNMIEKVVVFQTVEKVTSLKNEYGEFIRNYEYFIDGKKVKNEEYSRVFEMYHQFECFSDHTLILNSENKEINIIDIKPGMAIRTYNNNTKKMEISEVKELLEHKGKEYSLTKVVFINSNSLYASNSDELTLLEIQGTEKHPLLTNNGVKKIAELSLSDKLMYYNISTGLVEECEILNIVKNNKTVYAVYNLKFSNKNSFYLANGIPASSKCPFVHVKINGEYQLVDEILRNQVSNKLDREDVLEIPSKSISNGKLEVKIEEIKDEISFIDNIYLKIDDVIIYPSDNVLSEKLNSADNSFLQLNKGDSINLTFEIPFTLTGTEKVVLHAKGYYDLLPEAK
jgi:hypothetical protein